MRRSPGLKDSISKTCADHTLSTEFTPRACLDELFITEPISKTYTRYKGSIFHGADSRKWADQMSMIDMCKYTMI